MARESKLLTGVNVFLNIIDVEDVGWVEGKPFQHLLEDQRLGLEGAKLIRKEMVRYELQDAQVFAAKFVMQRVRVAQQTDARFGRNATDEIFHAFHRLPDHCQHRALEFLTPKLPGVLVRAVLRPAPATIEEIIHLMQKPFGRIVSPLVALDDRYHERLIVETVLRTVDAQCLEERLGVNVNEHVP
jgi:hypothetical protein